MITQFPIVEYETAPELGLLKWQSKMAIDLRWVASATPYGRHATAISLCGASDRFPIHCPYEDFMRDWMAAKAIKP